MTKNLSTSPQITRRATYRDSLIAVLIQVWLLLSAVFVLATAYFEILRWPYVVILLLGLIGAAGAWYFLRKGDRRKAAIFILLGLWFDIGLSFLIARSLSSPMFIAFCLLIIVTGMLSGKRAALISAVATGALVLIKYALLASNDQPLVAPTYNTLYLVFTLLILVAATCAITIAILTALQAAMQEVGRSQAEIAEKNVALEKEIRERISAETKLRSHHERNQLILESSLDGFMVTTIMGDILEVSETYAQRFGYAPEELIGANARDLLVDGQVEAIASDAIHLADGNNIRITVKQRHKDGRILTVEASSTYLKMGDDPQVFTFVRDITEQTEAVEKLYTNEARYRRLVEDMPLLVCRFLSDGTLTFVNDEYCAYFGLTREELLGTSFLARLPKKERKQIDAKLSHLSPKKPTVAYEYLSIGPNGNKRWHHWVDQALFNEQGDLIEYQSVGQDLTEFRQAQQALLQTQKLESLGLMSGGIAHDFNNLLTVILAQGSLAQLIIDEQHQAQPLLKKVVSAAEQAAQLTHQLLAYSGRTQLEKQPIDLNHLINENLSLFDVSRPKSVELVADLGRDLPPIEGDPGQIQQVIMNLIINAYEAIEEGAGRVTVSTNSAEMPPSPSVNGSHDNHFVPYGNQALPPGEYIELCVQDNGKGMDEQTVARIFDPFFSTKTKGRGLGLAAVLGIIRGHGGGMHVQSAPGMGTTFLLYLPAAPIEPAMPTAISAEVVREPVGGTVLLIDDEAIIRESVCSVLELQHIQTLMAPNGTTGLDMLQRHRDEIDLVLLDLSMPGMSGRETLQRLREMDSAVPVILSSGYHDTDMSKEMDALNVTCFLPKPYQANRLLDTIRPILRKKHLA